MKFLDGLSAKRILIILCFILGVGMLILRLLDVMSMETVQIQSNWIINMLCVLGIIEALEKIKK